MNRALVCTLTLAIATVASSAMAQVGLSLNLTYTDPADPSEGGTWELAVSGTDVVGVNAILADIDNPAGVATNVANEGETLIDDPNNPMFAPSFSVGGGVFQVGYVQDNVAGLVAGVGAGGLADALNNPAWDGSEIVVTGGTFGATRPSFTSAGGNVSEVNVLSGGSAVSAAFATIDGVLSPTVRGDSATTLGLETGTGLLLGDANRDGLVSLSTDVFPAVGNIGAGCSLTTTCGWNDGDANDDGIVSLSTDVFPAVGNIGNTSFVPPAVSAVPEPTSVALLALAGMAAAGLRRRS